LDPLAHLQYKKFSRCGPSQKNPNGARNPSTVCSFERTLYTTKTWLEHLAPSIGNPCKGRVSLYLIPKISPIFYLLNSHFVIIWTHKSSKCPKQNYETTALKSKSLLIKSPSSNKMASTKPLQSHHLSWKWKSSLKTLLCPLNALCLPLAMISPGIKQDPLLVFLFFEGCMIISKFMGFCF
jgi:hypothetical protein